MPSLARMIDANANRAREAARVLEDVARFVLDDATLAGALNALRHDLQSALATLPRGWLVHHRDTPGDVGTSLTTPQEQSREGIPAIVAAAAGRLGESLRSLEEAAKTFDGGLARRLETLRYRAYDLETRLVQRVGHGACRQWRVCVLLTESICTHDWLDTARAAMEGGADCIQLREKSLPGGELLRRARVLREMTAAAGVTFIVNDRADIALACDADGVHVGQNDLAVADVRRLAGHRLFVGVSTHDRDEAGAAVVAGADYCGVGAMFATSSKAGIEPAGAAWLRDFVQAWPGVPHLAIGGITPENVHELVDAGVRGVAVSHSVCAADDPGAAVSAMRGAIESRQQQPDRV